MAVLVCVVSARGPPVSRWGIAKVLFVSLEADIAFMRWVYVHLVAKIKSERERGGGV